MGLSIVVASVAVVPSALGWALQPYLPSSATFVLFHVAASGFAVALAAVEPWAHQTTGLLGKVPIPLGVVSVIECIRHKRETLAKCVYGTRSSFGLSTWASDYVTTYENAFPTSPYFMRSSLDGLVCLLPLESTCQCTGSWAAGQIGRQRCLMEIRLLSTARANSQKCTMPNVISVCQYGIPMVTSLTLVPTSHLPLPGVTARQIKEGVNWAMTQSNHGHAVYIHCAHGHGRSVGLLVACFLKSGRCHTIAEGEAMIKAIRPKIRLNTRQKREITRWMESERSE